MAAFKSAAMQASVLQEGLRLTEGQQQAVLAVRADAMAWLEQANSLRNQAFEEVGRELLWLTQVSMKHLSNIWN